MMLRMVRDDGQEMVFHGEDHDGWSIPSGGLEDFINLPLSLETSANVLTDGSTLISKRVGECERDVSVVYDGAGDPRAVRDQALSFFNPKHSFKAYVEYLGVTRWCEGELSGVQFSIHDESWPCVGDFTLLCLDPYMRSEDGNENSLTDAAPMFGFPYVSHARMPMPDGKKYPVGSLASKRLYDGLNTVYNSGDVDVMYRIVCTFDGDVKNPKFTKDGRFVQLLTSFKDGDELVIDFESAPPKVTVNGENAIQLCSRDSNFNGMQMTVGPNVFSYSCEPEGNRPLMNVQIRFNKRYLGV